MTEPVVAYRRALHQIPELDRDLPETLAFVRSRLEGLPCRLLAPIPGSLCAFFDAGKPETVAFRADLDALPVTEATGAPYASRHPGKMHACGHDGHTAMMLSLAETVAGSLSSLPRNVLFLFQPAEETTGGAEDLCRTGILQDHGVSRVFGLHLWPGLPAGSVWSRPGPLMARSSEITLELTGRSVHISRYREGLDALAAGAEFLRRAYAMVDDELPPEEPRVLRFGKMVSGTVRNAVSGETRLEGSLRSFSDGGFAFIKSRLFEIAGAVEAETGCTARLTVSQGYPPVSNPPAFYQALCRALGPDAPDSLAEPALAAEDFSFYQAAVPGVFFFLGVGDSAPLHNPGFAFDDEVILPAGVTFLKKLLTLA